MEIAVVKIDFLVVLIYAISFECSVFKMSKKIPYLRTTNESESYGNLLVKKAWAESQQLLIIATLHEG